MLQRLLSARGVSGCEGEVRKLIRELASPLSDEIITDNLGSVIATKNGVDPVAPTVLIMAHMDEVGLQIISVTEDGLLKYAPVGGIDPVVLASKRVSVGEKKVPGVIGSKAIHLQERAERTIPHKHKDFAIDIGAKDKKDALSMVSIGDYVTFDSEIVEFGEGLLKARALDDRVGCYTLLRLLEKRYPYTLVAAFTVQEEVGLRGATAVAHRVQPDFGITLEGTTANDTGETKTYQEVCRVGQGPVISFMDNASIACMPLMQALRDTAEKNGIPWQIKRGVASGNDAGAAQRAGKGTRTCVVSVPCRYIHSPSGVCARVDIDNTYKLLDAFLATGAKL